MWMNGHLKSWVGCGIGTMFSLAVLSFTVSMISKLPGAVAVSYDTQYLTTLAARASLQGVSSMAMQQGGLGLRMPLFLITVPPMAAAFLQGAVWQFVAPQLRTLRQS
jgi:type IV secretion system protein VirB6